MDSNSKNKYINFIFLFVFISVPTVLWWRVQTIDINRMSSLISGVGELAGIIGTVLFSLSIVLSARPIFLDKFFSGLDKLYDYHSKIGQIAFMLLLAHPLFLLARYAIRTRDAAAFFLPSDNWQQNFGILSLYLTILVIVLTLYLRPRYHIWKQIHKLLGVALLLGALHIYLSPSFVLHNSLVLSAYVFGWVFAGVSIWFYRSVLGKDFTRAYKYVVSNIVYINEQVFEIEFSTDGDKIHFTPGQFVFVSFLQTGISKEKHPFSIISSSEEGALKIAIKSLGDFTNGLRDNLRIGTSARIEGAFGRFSYSVGKKEKQIWIAGGIGVTPFMSMAQDLQNNAFFKVKMYYVVRKESDAVYINTLKALEKSTPNFSVTIFTSDNNGRINSKYVESHVPDIAERDILICAPPAMIHALKIGFRMLGVRSNNLYSEEFNF